MILHKESKDKIISVDIGGTEYEIYLVHTEYIEEEKETGYCQPVDDNYEVEMVLDKSDNDKTEYYKANRDKFHSPILKALGHWII